MTSDVRKKIAIVGSGISSVAAAWQLAPHADVTIFERSPFKGGHGYTAQLDIDGTTRDVDIGVQIIRPDITPNVFALIESNPDFAHIGLSEVPVSLVSVTQTADGAIRYGNAPEYQELPAFAADWQRLRVECERFEALTAELDEETMMVPVGAWVEVHGFSDDFVQGVLIPSMSVVNATRNGLLDGLFVTNLEAPSSLVSLQMPNIWYRFNDGVASFREVLLRGIEDCFETAAEIVACAATADDQVVATVRRGGGQTEDRVFDALIWGGDLPSARRALDHEGNPDREAHRQALDPFETEPAWVYVHEDMSWVPADVPYTSASLFEARNGQRRMHYNLDVIKEMGRDKPLWVTLCNEQVEPPEKLCHPPIAWAHPCNTPAIFGAQRQLQEVQGLGGIWFCGSGTVVDGFDSCLVSGLAIAARVCADVGYLFAEPETELQAGALEMYRAMVGVWMFPELS